MAHPASVPANSDNFTGNLRDGNREFDVSGGEEPKIMVNKPSIRLERQISVNPISVQESSVSSSTRNQNFNLMVSPSVSPPSSDPPLPPLPVPTKTKFLSSSLPSSAATSPKSRLSVLWKTAENKENGETLRSKTQKFEGQSLSLAQNATISFRRSKSCGEGRAFAPSLDFDFLTLEPKILRSQDANNHQNCNSGRLNQNSVSSKSLSSRSHGSFLTKSASQKTNKSFKSIDSFEDGFKCSAICLYLPGFGKGKPVRSMRKDGSTPGTTTTTSTRTASLRDNSVISARASLEKFECGSWASSTLIHDESNDTGSRFFDLPLELIKGNAGPDEPVSAAFLFEKEPLGDDANSVFLLEKQSLDAEIKGVLKTSGSKSRRSVESPRHVRFSTSSPVSYPTSPTCVTPRLIKATEDFTAFLEVQTV